MYSYGIVVRVEQGYYAVPHRPLLKSGMDRTGLKLISCALH